MLKLLKHMKGKILLVALIAPLMMLLEVSMDLLQPKLMADIIDIGLVNEDLSYIYLVGSKMIGAALIGLIGGIGCSIFTSIAAAKMGERLREVLFDKIQTLSFLEIDKFNTGSLITRLTNDVTQVQKMIEMALRGAVRAPLLCLGGIVMAATLSPELSVVFLVSIPIILIAVIIIVKKSFPLFIGVQGRIDGINNVMRENILGVRVIKAFGLEQKQSEIFHQSNEELMDASIRAQNINMILWPIVTLVMNLSVIAVLWVGGNMSNNGVLEVGKIMAFINYLIQIMGSLIMLVMLVINFSRAKASVERINEVLNTEPSLTQKDTAVEATGYDITFKNVTFRYNDHSEDVLNDISLEIKEGEKVGIIGGTGSGKSSFVNLIPRLYDVSEGEILIGGVNIKDIKTEWLRKEIGVVLQESILFSGTIEENLKFGNKEAAKEWVEEAAKDAQAYEFIMTKEDTYQSKVEQRGQNLSGGQKQRLSIARTLVQNPKILIMDDSSSALDVATEGKLQNALKDRMKDSTVLIIAQRISGVMDADKIIVLEDGEISAVGTHEMLLRSCILYRDIAVSQLGEEVLTNV